MTKKKIQTEIINYLKLKNIYSEAYLFQLEILIDQYFLYLAARKAIKHEGVSVYANAENTFKVRNQNFKTLDECIGNIMKLSKLLSIDLSTVKAIVQDEDDQFDALK